MTTTDEKDVRDVTLDEFETQLREYAGRDVGFADAVRDYWAASKQLAAVEAARKAVFERIKVEHAKGNTVVQFRPEDELGPGKVLRQAKPSVRRVPATVPSARIKRWNGGLWKAARVPTSYMKVTAPPSARVAAPEGLAVPDDSAKLYDLLKAYEAMPSAAEFTEAKTDAKIRLAKIAADMGDWDGLPIEFADGWVVGTHALRYSSDKLREIAPDVWEKLADPPRDVETAGRVYVDDLKPGRDDVDPYAQ